MGGIDVQHGSVQLCRLLDVSKPLMAKRQVRAGGRIVGCRIRGRLEQRQGLPVLTSPNKENGLAVVCVCVASVLPTAVHCCHRPQKFEFTESMEASVVNHFTPGEAKTKLPWLSSAGTMPMAQSLE